MVCSDVYNGETASTVLSAEIRCFDLGDVFLAFCQGVWWCTSNTVWFGAGQLIILSFPGNGCEWLWIIWLLRCYILVVSNLKVSVHEDIRPITIIIHHSHNSRFFTRLTTEHDCQHHFQKINGTVPNDLELHVRWLRHILWVYLGYITNSKHLALCFHLYPFIIL